MGWGVSVVEVCSGMEVCSGVGMCEDVLCSHTPPPPPQTDR